MEVNLVKIEGKPLTKLIETVSAGIGTLYRPTSIRKEAKAEAERIKIIAQAEADALIIKTEANYELVKRAQSRFVNEQVNKQINIENVAQKTEKYLPENVSETPVDVDWRTKFFNKCQDVSNEEMQEIWAKILAEEINAPGQTSLRTLDIVSTLTVQEATLFEKLCAMTFSGGQIIKLHNKDALHDFGIMYSDLLTLKSTGLIHENDTLQYVYRPILSYVPNIAVIKFGNITIRITRVYDQKSSSLEAGITFDVISLTGTGAELNKILNVSPNMDYLNAIIEDKKKWGLDFEIIEEKK
jgi:uncharacterized repeat protein (TIGR03899 family)